MLSQPIRESHGNVSQQQEGPHSLELPAFGCPKKRTSSVLAMYLESTDALTCIA